MEEAGGQDRVWKGLGVGRCGHGCYENQVWSRDLCDLIA